jgi:hypothetical protein
MWETWGKVVEKLFTGYPQVIHNCGKVVDKSPVSG